ncbi:hypothetical protein C27AD_00550 [Salinisphaera hydrothermalis C27AD]
MKRLVPSILITLLILASVLASPAVMAWSMPSSSSPSTACALCQADPASQQHAPPATTTCVLAMCSMTADTNDTAAALVLPPRAIPGFHLRAHLGRMLSGPDPFPPRFIRV